MQQSPCLDLDPMSQNKEMDVEIDCDCNLLSMIILKLSKKTYYPRE